MILLQLSYFLVFGTAYNASIGLWWVLAYTTFPIFFLKQLINVVQLVIASQDIVAFDVAERRKARS